MRGCQRDFLRDSEFGSGDRDVWLVQSVERSLCVGWFEGKTVGSQKIGFYGMGLFVEGRKVFAGKY